MIIVERTLINEIMASDLYIAIYSENFQDNEIKTDIDETINELREFERKYSRFISDNELDKFNNSEEIQVSEDLHKMLEISKEYWIKSNGVFNPLIHQDLIKEGYAVSKKENFVNNEISNKTHTQSLDFNLIQINSTKIKKPKELKIDLGGIGKGYIIEKISKRLNTKYENFCISIGGDMFLAGKDIAKNYNYWAIEIQNPFEGIELDLPTLIVTNKGIATSGTYKRKWKIQEKEKNHIIDTRSKESTHSDLISVTVVNSSTITSDIMAKVLLVQGEEKAKKVCLEQEIAAVFINKDKKIYITDEGEKYVWKE